MRTCNAARRYCASVALVASLVAQPSQADGLPRCPRCPQRPRYPRRPPQPHLKLNCRHCIFHRHMANAACPRGHPTATWMTART